jgi:hypothetical protein
LIPPHFCLIAAEDGNSVEKPGGLIEQSTGNRRQSFIEKFAHPDHIRYGATVSIGTPDNLNHSHLAFAATLAVTARTLHLNWLLLGSFVVTLAVAAISTQHPHAYRRRNP